MALEFDILRILEAPQHGPLRSRFRHIKIDRGALLPPHDKEDPDIAFLLSGQIRAYLSCGEQEITIFNAERGCPILVTSRLFLSARRASEILVAPRAMFLQVMMATPELYAPMYLAIERLFTQSLRVIEGMRFLTVRERLIRYLVDLADQTGRSMEDGLSIPFDQTIESVANDIGSSRQTTSQTLNSLIKGGHIRRLSRRQLIIPHIGVLKKILQEADLAQRNFARLALEASDAYPVLPLAPPCPEETGDDTPALQATKL